MQTKIVKNEEYMKNQDLKWLYTEQGEKLSSRVYGVYPRPQLRRDSFFSLDGEWDFYAGKNFSGEYDRKIIVPFCPESPLSQVRRNIQKGEKLYYKKSFRLQDGFVRDRVILHFGAVDCICRVELNGREIGKHEGGYHAFSFDVTEELCEGENTICVCVEDELDHLYPYGKQKRDRGGMWYTPVSGIWQSVWMESVPEGYVKSLKIDTKDSFVRITAEGVLSGEIKIKAPNGEKTAQLVDSVAEFEIEDPVFWSPENPHLYEFTLLSGEDKVESYFALRTLSVCEVGGYARLCLNGKPYYFHGLLDQGYYSDGIYTPASPECYENDILFAKRMGFNTLRKHIKIESELFYYYCDKLGMVVFQDMVNNGSYSFLRDTALPTVGLKGRALGNANPRKESRERFLTEMRQTVASLYNHPCICYWTIFNEGWGQFETGRMYDELCALDKTRFIDTASGWFRPEKTDVESLHVYFKPVKLKKSALPIVLSEYGGYSYKIEDHSFNVKNTYGYGKFKDKDAFEEALSSLFKGEVVRAIECGLCADIYTQLSDVEDETNGFFTYDRRVKKTSESFMRELSETLYSAFERSLEP